MPSPATIVSTVPDLGWSVRGGLSFTGADLAERPGERPDRRSEDRGANHVEPALDAAIFRREDQQNSHCYERERRVDPEHGWPAEGLGQPAAQDRTSGGGESRCRRPYADRPVPLRARIGGPDQGEAGGGDDRCGRSLHDAGSDQPGGRRRQRASRGRQTEQDATEPEHARLAINIRERAADQCQRGERQHIPVENPLNGGEVRTEISAQSR